MEDVTQNSEVNVEIEIKLKLRTSSFFLLFFRSSPTFKLSLPFIRYIVPVILDIKWLLTPRFCASSHPLTYLLVA